MLSVPSLHRLPLIVLTITFSITSAFAEEDGVGDPASGSVLYLDQNWSGSERLRFYHADQGTRLIPYEIFLSLEIPDGKTLFRYNANLRRYRFLPSVKTGMNPDGLPVGFSRNGDFVGITCAACHTQSVHYRGKQIRIDGGQAMIDLPMFLEDLERAMLVTLEKDDKLSRYLERRQGSDNSGELEEELRRQYVAWKDYNRRNATPVKYGFSRLDAFGAILNKGLYLTGVRDNFNPPNAPTSFPYLWDTPQHDYVEWNGSQSNSSVGALARNVGEVIGVYAEVETTPEKWLYFLDGGYPSSIQVSTLRKLEKTVAKLHSPAWPDIFPAIDQAKADKGRRLYTSYCISCHLDIDRTDPDRKIRVRMSSLATIATDPLMVRNALDHRGKTGIFRGKPRFYDTGEILGETAPALFIVNNIMVGVLKNNPLQVLLARRDARALGHGDEIHPPKYLDGVILQHGTETTEKALLAYKARPLNGIWTGAPYLHNGSVPNLYQLLLPATERVTSFHIGEWEFDPVHVGYVTTPAPGTFLFDTTLPGNSNSGHEYGTGKDGLPRLTEKEIWALVEYMKTL